MIQNSRLISCGTNPRGKPAAERTGLRREGAALRPGAAAGCGGSSPEPQIQYSKFIIHNYDIGPRLEEIAHDCKELLPSARGGAAAGCGGFL